MIFANRRVRLETTDDLGVFCVKWRQSPVTVYNVGNNTMRRIRTLTRDVKAEKMAGVRMIRIAPPRGSAAWSEWERWVDSYNKAVGDATADRVENDPSLIERARKGIRGAKSILPPPICEGIQTWERTLSGESSEAVLAAVLGILRDPGPEGTLLRRASPFQGMVPEDEREAILRECDKS